jgi:hypothetical protein
MRLASKSACALMLAAVFFAGIANRLSALPMHSVATATSELLIPAACKYGSGKCANVKPGQVAPSTDKHGPQDPTVDPDCKAYGNCHDGPNGGPAAAKTQAPTKPTAAVSGVKGESMDPRHPATIDMQSRKTGASALNNSAQNITVRKAGKGQQ